MHYIEYQDKLIDLEKCGMIYKDTYAGCDEDSPQYHITFSQLGKDGYIYFNKEADRDAFFEKIRSLVVNPNTKV